MSDPILGSGAGIPGSSGATASTGSGARTVACLFATRARAEEARNALVQAGIPETASTLTSQEAGTSTQGTSDTGGMWDSLKRLFSGDDLESYYEGVSRGQTLLSVRAQSADDADRIIEILDRYDPVDLDEQEAGWRSQGWTGHHAATTQSATAFGTAAGGSDMAGGDTAGIKPAAPSAATTTDAALAGRATATEGQRLEGEQVIPIVEEQLRVGKREAGRSSVRVRAYTVETPVEEEVRLREERVRIERRPVDREVTAGDAEFRDRTVELTETREEAVVQKTARVTEEVVIGKDVQERTEHVSDTVRHTEVEIEQDGRTDRTATGTSTGVPQGGAGTTDTDLSKKTGPSAGSSGGLPDDDLTTPRR